MDTSKFSSVRFSSTSSPKTMSERLVQEGKPGDEERVVAKPKPLWNCVSKTVDRSPMALGSSASHSLGTHEAHSSKLDLTSAEKPVARGLSENTASSSQVWHSDAEHQYWETCGGMTKNPFCTILSHRN